MIRDDWEEIWTLNETRIQIGYPWFFVGDLIGDWALIRLEAQGQWACLGKSVQPCGPNGHPELQLATERLFVPDAAPGALIGKFGGSVAGRADGVVFVIGEQCVVAMPEKKNAQLFIGINGSTPNPSNVLERLTLKISGVVDP